MNRNGQLEQGGSYLSRSALCEYRGDLPERCQRAGVKDHGGFYGCLCCMEPSSSIHDRVAGVTLASSPWIPRNEDKYFDELHTHLVEVPVATQAEKQLLAATLEFCTSIHGVALSLAT